MKGDQQTIERLIDQLRAGSSGLPPIPPDAHSDRGQGGPKPPTDDPLKARVDFLQTAFLWLAGALLTAVVGIIAIAVTMTNATNGRLDKVNEGVSGLNREVGQLSTKIDEANTRLEKIDQKIDQLKVK